MKLKLFFALGLLFLLESIGAQVSYYNFNSNSGLPSNEMYCVFQDHHGYIWFGTDHGVVKYDGHSFKTYTSEEGLTDNTVFKIKEDDAGRLWFLTLAGGICYYNGHEFLPHPQNDSIKAICNKRIPTSWQVLHDKVIWLGLVDFGFYKISTDKVASYLNRPPGVKGMTMPNEYFYLLTFKDSSIVYTSNNGYNELPEIKDTSIIEIRKFNMAKNKWFYTGLNFSLLRQPGKEILISQWNHLLHIQDSDLEDDTQLSHHVSIGQLKQTSDKKIWVLSQGTGAYAISTKSGAIKFADSLLFSASTSDVCLDNEGNYWFTTLDNGIYLLPNRNIRNLASHDVNSKSKISGLTADDQNLFAIMPEGKILKVDTGIQTSIIDATLNNDESISGLTISHNGKPISTRDASLEWFARLWFYITKIVLLKDEKVLVGGTEGFALVSKNKVIFDSREVNFNRRVTELCETSPGKFLIGTFNGLCYFSIDSGYKITEESALENIRITSCSKLDTSLFAVSTRGKGIYLKYRNRFFSITEAKGLISNLAEGLYFENDSILWVASFKGLSKVHFRFAGDSLYTRIKCYSREDGLCSDQITSITGFNGSIWLGTNEGLCYFKPTDLSEDTVLIPIYFGGILINGIKHPAGALNLKYDQNNFLIEFNAIYYKAVSGVRYKVRLKGMEQWKFTNQNFVQYFNLAPGNYEFEVAAEDRFGKYRSDIHSLKFTIQPRFIDTVLFKSLLALFFLSITGIIIYMLFNFQRLKSQNVIKLLQAEFKALNYQINPHFIFNVLNSIQYYILRKDTSNAVHLLSSFAVLIRKIVGNSKQQYISVLEEVECLKEYLELEKMRLENKFEYELNIDSGIDIEQKNILPMIIQPLVENSIWHGIVPADRAGNISISFKKQDGRILCIVDDNGIGINAAGKERKGQNNLSLAMINVSERLKIISELNNSTWKISMEDKSDQKPNESGTKVTVLFPALKH